ncbi:hypothetical protein GJ654_10065 [Rhodoblastus acidophilus]|uniref:Uncharacterized protein n=1 Tax=Rhodoblastus acidophilus TaxID=1074 RepID=A0A6N8DLQ3_RHOAC|nr:hypothetical protein [Rhodoblastus acidophilus]MCW2275065.1 hypothetical protein [Rhodoblastus acidophilus]MTV31337.1 hypothetical protein [Rhodoblastus acidophilus]
MNASFNLVNRDFVARHEADEGARLFRRRRERGQARKRITAGADNEFFGTFFFGGRRVFCETAIAHASRSLFVFRRK